MKKIIILILLLFSVSLFAQKKVIIQAKQYLKTGKDLDKAEQILVTYLNDSTNKDNMKVRGILFDVLKKQYELENEKLYLKNKADTSKLFNTLIRLYEIAETSDSIEQTIYNLYKKKNPKHRDKNSEYLHSLRSNLYSGGFFYKNKNDYKQAFKFYDQYINCATNKLFSTYNYLLNDSLLSYAAVWSTFCGKMAENADMILKHSKLALTNKSNKPYIQQYISEAYMLRKDTINFIQELKNGFENYPKHIYFFTHLADYYTKQKNIISLQSIIDRALTFDENNMVFLLAKSTLSLNIGEYDECLNICSSLISNNDSLKEAYYNMGLAYFNKALKLEALYKNNKQTKKNIIYYYKKSRPYIEKYRQMAAEERAKWLPILYTIYLNLNMGKEFDEINNLLKNKE